jgi:SAGA-associated factor 29
MGERASTRDRDRDRDKDRDSIGPKAGSVEPSVGGASTPAASGAATAAARSKVVFAKGESVAFKPKVSTGEAGSDWILGEVAQVVGEGKSRRYKVLDVEPDDQSKQKEYKTSASSMIPITPESQAASLPDWEPQTTVLALYPNTTTFYRAEVHSMDGQGRVNLKFEGENDSSTLQQVERRFVIEYRA